MPILAIRFGGPSSLHLPDAMDVHLLRGQSTGPLRERLWVHDASDDNWKRLAEYEAANDDVDVEFNAVFKWRKNGDELEEFGIHVHTVTGKVRIDTGAAPQPSPANFLVEGMVMRNDGGLSWVTMPSAILRVHVHRSVQRVWLTPKRLSIRRKGVAVTAESTECRFAVRAQFDDVVVGDVTHSRELTFTPPAWFDRNEIRIPASAAETVSPFTVKVTTSTTWNSKTADAEIEVLRSWASEPNMPRAELIDGAPGVWDGTLKPENVPNPLILGCGFTGQDQEAFRAITNLMVNRMKNDPILQPFGYLGTSINYWRLMVPAQEAGTSVRCEVQQWLKGGHLFASLVPLPIPNPPTAADWTLEHLIYMAGLPVLADVGLVKDKDTDQPIASPDALREHDVDTLDFAPLFGKWATTLRLEDPMPMVESINTRIIKQWLALADRTFIDEVNNFPAISVGSPPAAGFKDSARLEYHELRRPFDFLNDERDVFFKRVKAEPRNGVTVTLDDSGSQAPELGNLWLTARPGFAFENEFMIAMLSNLPYGRANAEIHVRLYTKEATIPDGDTFEVNGVPVARAVGLNALTLALPAPSVASLDSNTWRVYAHELAHTFGLGDEYAEGGRFTGAEIHSSNLTTEAAVVDPATSQVHLHGIKWNWHRVRKASVLQRRILMKLNGIFHAYVRKGSGGQLAVGEFVRLRKREPRKEIDADPVTSHVEFRVEAIHPANIDDPGDIRNMTIVLKNDEPLVDIDPFGPGSIVYLPIPAPASSDPFLRPYLTLVSPAAERIMAAMGGTMTGLLCDVDLDSGSGTQVPLMPDPQNRVAEKDLPGLVGVYFGGAQYACGVLHPTGQCIMRDSDDDTSRFCPVCRYVLVDYIDPEQHWWIDRDYDKQYPL